MKVLHLIKSTYGGAGIACLLLHNALLANGISSKVLQLDGLPKQKTRDVYQVRSKETFWYKVMRKLRLSNKIQDVYMQKIQRIKGTYETVSLPFSSYQLHLHPLVKEADLIHLHWVADFVDTPSFFQNVKKKIVWTFHDLNPISGLFHYQNDAKINPNLGELDRELKAIKINLLKKHQPTIVATSNYTAKQISERLPGYSFSQISCVFDTEAWKPLNKITAKEQLDLALNVLVIGIGAQQLHNPWKGADLLWKALRELPEMRQRQLQIITFGKQQQPMPKLAANHVVTHIENSSDITQMNLCYAAMDVFINPSFEETFGQTSFEALLCNTPVLGSRTGAMPEYIDEEKNGWLFSPGSQQSFNEKLKQACLQFEQGATPFKWVRESALGWYKNADPVQKHLTLYKKLMQA